MVADVEAVVEAFNDCINRADIDGLSRLMTDGHRFVDSAARIVSGKEACLSTWKEFFSAFPDYRNRFDRLIVGGDKVVIVDSSTCSDHRLAGPALWQATMSGHRVDEWRVFDDSPANRVALGISG